MLKKMRKRIRQRRLAQALALTLALACPAAPACADTGAQTFNDGQPHTVSDNIVTAGVGLRVENAGTLATMNGWSITTSGGGFAAYTMAGGTINLTNAAVNTSGGGYGLIAVNAGSTVTMSGGSVTTSGASSTGAFTSDDGAISLTNTAVATSGNGSRGLYAFKSTVTMRGGSIATTGVNSTGAFSSSYGTINLTNITVSTAGTGSHGLLASTAGGTVTMRGGAVTTTGDNSHGAYAVTRGAVSLTNAAVTTSGDSSHGLYATDDIMLGPGVGGTVTMSGGAVATAGANSHGAYAANGGTVSLTNATVTTTGVGSYALYVNDGTVTATVNGQDISGAAGLLYAAGGTVSLTAGGGSRLSGSTALGGGGTANLSLSGGATWTMPGNSGLTTLSLSGGSVVFAAPAAGGPYKTLTAGGNLAGSGGAFYLNANLGAELSDLISVGGAAGGSHALYVANAGGAPANLYSTVRLLSVSGANTATFGGGSDVGAWRYGVARGANLPSAYTYGGAAVNTLAGASGDCYLYNTFGPSTASRAAMALSADTVVVWYGEMNEIKKRLGDLRMGAQSGDDFWARVYADRYGVEPGGGGGYTQLMRGVEIGRDNPQAFAGGKKYTGFLAGAGRAGNTFAAGGDGATDSVYAGAYGSWLRDDGAYFDLVGKYNRFSHRFDTPLLGGGRDSGSYRNTGLGLSAEIGKRFERGHGAFIQPEAELSALWSGSADYTTAGGLAVRVPSTDSLQLRLGVTAGRKWQDAGGAAMQFYGKVSWVNEYRGANTVRVDGASFDASLKGHQWVAGVGYIEDNGRRQLYIDVEKSWGNAVSKSWGVNAGYRWKF